MASKPGPFFVSATDDARPASAAAQPATTADPLMGCRLWRIFWLGLPIFLGLLLGWSQAGSAKQLGRLDGLLFVITGVLPSWWLYGLLGTALKRLLPRLPYPALLVSAPVVASFLLKPLYVGRKALFGLPRTDVSYPQFAEPLDVHSQVTKNKNLNIGKYPAIDYVIDRAFSALEGPRGEYSHVVVIDKDGAYLKFISHAETKEDQVRFNDPTFSEIVSSIKFY